jgi:hypothetical protein
MDVTSGFVTVSGTVTNDGAAPRTATVVLLCPNPDESTLEVKPDENDAVDVFEFSQVPIGLRAIRANIDGTLMTKYVYVLHTGLSLSMNIVTPPPPSP